MSKSEVSSQKKASEDKVIKLNNNCGYMMKELELNLQLSGIRDFLQKKIPKSTFILVTTFLTTLQDWQLKPENFTTYEEFYNNGAVKCGSNVTEVKCIVDANRALFEKESDKIDRAQQLLEQGVDLEDAWA